MPNELPASEHFFIEQCHWLRDQPYTVTAKEGIPAHLRRWLPSFFSTPEGAKIGLTDAEAYYDEQSALAAHISQLLRKKGA